MHPQTNLSSPIQPDISPRASRPQRPSPDASLSALRPSCYNVLNTSLYPLHVVMFPSPPTAHLVIRRPSATTAQFTVSTCSPPSLYTPFITLLSLLVRSLLGSFTLATLYLKHAPSGPPDGLRTTILSSSPGQLAARLADFLAWHTLLPLALAAGWAVCARFYTEESLLVLRGLGIQTSTSSPTYLSTSSTRFLPTREIQDLLVHEAFRGWEVRFFLGVVVGKADEAGREGGGEVVVVFPNLLPKRKIVERVWRGARAALYEPAAEGEGPRQEKRKGRG